MPRTRNTATRRTGPIRNSRWFLEDGRDFGGAISSRGLHGKAKATSLCEGRRRPAAEPSLTWSPRMRGSILRLERRCARRCRNVRSMAWRWLSLTAGRDTSRDLAAAQREQPVKASRSGRHRSAERRSCRQLWVGVGLIAGRTATPPRSFSRGITVATVGARRIRRSPAEPPRSAATARAHLQLRQIVGATA